ncbi:MAG: hypothetical protein LBF87_09430 [Treponema sp.]|jgi:type III restriction enzyme|nr:hypothetical protein [Treponema sp.]
MSDKLVNSISGRLSLRRPLAESLGILARITGIISLDKTEDLQQRCSIIQSEYPLVSAFGRIFSLHPSWMSLQTPVMQTGK